MKIAVLGSTGMLGWAVGNYMIKKYGEENVWLSNRDFDKSYAKNTFYFDPLNVELSTARPDGIPPCDVLLNAIGIIKPHVMKDPAVAIQVNSVFPWKLAAFCKHWGTNLIHITTDCIYDGAKGHYTEDDPHTCNDFYGKSKSLGEPNNCMVLRTSIIGEEAYHQSSLIEWAKSQKGQKVMGFTNHLWNGVTTLQYAKICSQIIDNGLYQDELFHVYSNEVTKEQLLHLISDRFNLELDIGPVEATEPINRTLSTIKTLNSKLNIPVLSQQISEM